MATTLHERLLYAEARIAMLEDRWDDLRSRLRDWRNVLVAAGELVLLYLIVLVLGRLDLGGKK